MASLCLRKSSIFIPVLATGFWMKKRDDSMKSDASVELWRDHRAFLRPQWYISLYRLIPLTWMAACDDENPWKRFHGRKRKSKEEVEAEAAAARVAEVEDKSEVVNITKLDTSMMTMTGISDREEEEEEEVDMSPAEHCGFCAYFLKSPCKLPFHRWRLCVEAKKEAGEDFTEACLDLTRALAVCVDVNKLDFGASMEEDDEEAAEQEESGAEATGAQPTLPKE
jgi:hypothetical protein